MSSSSPSASVFPALTQERTSSALAPASAWYASSGTSGHSGCLARARRCHFALISVYRDAEACNRSTECVPVHGHLDVEDPGERGFLGKEAEERPAARAQAVLVRGVVGHGPRRLGHMVEQELAAPAGRREEAVFLGAEVDVERGAGNLRAAHDVGHRDGRIPLLRDRGDRGLQQPLALRRVNGGRGKPAAAARQARLARVRFSEAALLLSFKHEPRVTGKFLKYRLVL